MRRSAFLLIAVPLVAPSVSIGVKGGVCFAGSLDAGPDYHREDRPYTNGSPICSGSRLTTNRYSCTPYTRSV